MNQQPEKLFREKLEPYAKPAPVMAWSRIEKNLDKKKNNFLWLKIAASLLLVAVATLLLWPSSNVTPAGLQSKNEIPETKNARPDSASKVKEPVAQIAQPKQENAGEKGLEKRERKTAASRRKPHATNNAHDEVKNVQAPLAITQSEKPLIETSDEMTSSSVNTADPVVAETAPPVQQGVTLIYSAEEVDEKYLDKKALAEATSKDKKPSTLRKLFDKAYDLKNNQDPFGDLRQKKNEILALNFKNEKQRSQNK
jgi:hypothetical protein